MIRTVYGKPQAELQSDPDDRQISFPGQDTACIRRFSFREGIEWALVCGQGYRQMYFPKAFILLFAVAAFTAAPTQAGIVFDTYSTFQDAEDSTADGSTVFSNTADSGVFGGFRRLVSSKSGPAGGSRVSLFSNGFGLGNLTFDQQGPSSGAFGIGTLIYDGDAAGTTDTVNPSIPDTDLTVGKDQFVLSDLVVLGDGIDLTINVFDGTTISSFTVELPNQPTAADFVIPFSLLSDQTVLTSTNAISLQFDGTELAGALSGRGSDLAFSSFSTASSSTPEPASFWLSGIGLLGLMRTRRRRRTIEIA